MKNFLKIFSKKEYGIIINIDHPILEHENGYFTIKFKIEDLKKFSPLMRLNKVQTRELLGISHPDYDGVVINLKEGGGFITTPVK